MKKFLIAIICMIPIVVVLALSTAGRIIISAGPVNARDISIRGSDNEELQANEVITLSLEDRSEFIVVELLPTITDQTIIYELDDNVADAGKLTLERVDNTSKYKIVPIESGVARVIVRAHNNHGVFKTFTVHILEKTLKELIIYDDGGSRVTELELTSPIKLNCDIIPITALSNNRLEWASENEEIARVMPNGTVYPVSPGKTQIRATATDTMGNRLSAFVAVDTTRAVVKDTVLFSSKAVDEGWVYTHGVVNKGATVSRKSGNVFSVYLDGAETEVTVVTTKKGDWELKEVPETLYTNSAPYFLRAGYTDSDAEGEIAATYYVDDAGKARVEGGVLKPLSAGSLKLYAAYGSEVREYTVEIRNRPLYFDLNMNKEDGMLGIKMDRLFGINWLDANRQLTNTYAFGAKLDKNAADLLWEVSDPEAAEISQDAVITFNEKALGKRIIVTATVMAGSYRTTLKRSFGFHIAQDPSAINTYGTDEFFHVVENIHGSPVVMQSEVKLTRTAYLTASLYGNGFRADGSVYEDLRRWNSGIHIEGDRIHPDISEIMIEDIVVEMAEDYASSAMRGQAVSMHKVQIPAVIKNVITRYAHDGLVIDKCKEVLVEGCITGDSYFTAMMILNEPGNENRLTLRNNLVRQTQGPTILTFISPVDMNNLNTNSMPYLSVEGFLDVYNWKTEDEIKKLMDSMDPSILEDFPYIEPAQLFRMIGEGIRSMFTRKEMQNIAYVDPVTKEKYYCVGILMLGLFQTLDMDRLTMEDEGYAVHKLEFPTDDNSTIASVVSIIEFALKFVNQEMTIMHPNYVLTYDMKDGAGPRNKPGDPVPQTKELYERLNRYYAEQDALALANSED